jgi:hypothetical protein
MSESAVAAGQDWGWTGGKESIAWTWSSSATFRSSA